MVTCSKQPWISEGTSELVDAMVVVVAVVV